MKKSSNLFLFFASLLFAFSGCQKTISSNAGTIKISFRNTVNGSPIVLGTTTYTKPFGESCTISKFKYYVSNVRLGLSGVPAIAAKKESYHLIDQGLPESLSISFDEEENSFITLGFLLGVDSTRNVSGAQTGAFDPLNDMFWT